MARSDVHLTRHFDGLQREIIPALKKHAFREVGTLFDAPEHVASTDVSPAIFSQFIASLQGESIEITHESLPGLRALCEEFGYDDLIPRLDSFSELVLISNSTNSTEQISVFERRLIHLEELVSSLNHRIASTQTKFSNLSRSIATLSARADSIESGMDQAVFQSSSDLVSKVDEIDRVQKSEQFYRRGCEALFGSNGFGKGGEFVSIELGLSELKKSADLGNSDAQFVYGWWMEEGNHPGNEAEGVQYLKQSAEQGNSYGEFGYGFALIHGHGVKINERQGAEWLRKSSNAGNARGQNDFGDCCENGTGVQIDIPQAIALYERSASQCNSWGEVSLGMMFEQGNGVPPDRNEAIRLYRLAWNQGLEFAGEKLDGFNVKR